RLPFCLRLLGLLARRYHLVASNSRQASELPAARTGDQICSAMDPCEVHARPGPSARGARVVHCPSLSAPFSATRLVERGEFPISSPLGPNRRWPAACRPG